MVNQQQNTNYWQLVGEWWRWKTCIAERKVIYLLCTKWLEMESMMRTLESIEGKGMMMLQRTLRGLEKTSRGSWSSAGGGFVKVEVASLREGPGSVPEVGEVPSSQAGLVREGEGEEGVELGLEGGGGGDQGGGEGGARADTAMVTIMVTLSLLVICWPGLTQAQHKNKKHKIFSK